MARKRLQTFGKAPQTIWHMKEKIPGFLEFGVRFAKFTYVREHLIDQSGISPCMNLFVQLFCPATRFNLTPQIIQSIILSFIVISRSPLHWSYHRLQIRPQFSQFWNHIICVWMIIPFYDFIIFWSLFSLILFIFDFILLLYLLGWSIPFFLDVSFHRSIFSLPAFASLWWSPPPRWF